MSEYAEKLRAAREKLEIKVDKATFFGTYATVEQALLYNRNSGTVTDAEICRRHINNWSGVKASDIFPGAPDKEIPFDKDDFNEIIGERLDWFSAISREIVSKSLERVDELAKSKKK